MAMSLEEKVYELGRQVLGPDVSLCLDAEHVIDRVAEKLAQPDPDGTVAQRLDSLETDLASAESTAEDALSDARRAVEECSRIEGAINDLRREGVS